MGANDTTLETFTIIIVFLYYAFYIHMSLSLEILYVLKKAASKSVW
jgi:hypothetical protein